MQDLEINKQDLRELIEEIQLKVDNVRQAINLHRDNLPKIENYVLKTDLSNIEFYLNWYRGEYSITGRHVNPDVKFTINGIKYCDFTVTYEFSDKEPYDFIRHYVKFKRFEKDSKGENFPSHKAREIVNEIMEVYIEHLFKKFSPYFEYAKLKSMCSDIRVTFDVGAKVLGYLK